VSPGYLQNPLDKVFGNKRFDMRRGLVCILVLLALSLGFLNTALGQSKEEAIRLNKQGMEAYKYGRYQEALKYFNRSLEICRELNIPIGIATSLNNIGGVYKSLGQHEKALSYYEGALKIDRELNISQEIATDLNNIGAVYYSLGQYEKALAYYKEAKIKKEHNLSPESIAISLNNIGGVYYSLGQYEKALAYYEGALKIKRELKIPQDIAMSLNNIGAVCDSLGQYEKALSYHEGALKIRRELKIPIGIAISLNNIGMVYYSLGQYEKALSYYEGALKIDRELKTPQDIAGRLDNIGAVYLTQKRYKEAEIKFLEAKKEKGKTGIKWGGNSGLVELYIATGRHKPALELLKEMTPRWNDDDPYRIQFHTQHGLALKGSGLVKPASKEFFKAVSITEEMRQRVKERGGFFGAGYYGGRIRAYRGLVSTLSERAIMGEKVDKEFSPYGKDISSNAFYFSEAMKARTLIEAMAESARKSEKAEIPEEFREKEQSILSQLSAIDSQWDDAYKRGEDVLRRLKERKDGLNTELNNLITELRQKYPRYAALNYPKPIPPEELPLKEDEVLLEYALGDDAGYVFVVRKGGVKKLIKIPFSKEALEAKVKAFIEPMNTKQVEKFSVKEAKGLYELLLADALKDVKESDRIIVVPDGILGLLPFESLVIKEGRDYKNSFYVGDRYNITYYQSATVLALQRNLKERKTERLLFALGNPIYTKEDPRYLAWKDNKKTTMVASLDKYSFRGIAIKAKWGKTTETDTTGKEVEFPPLPETEIEVKEIAKMMNVSPQPPDVLLSVRANETELRKTGLERYKYIHFATHASLPGMIQGLNEPFILLGQVENESKDDGFLTLSEVLDLRLNADIVVLSACVTGVGKEVEGEGVANFARAFQHAGVKSVVVSLWEVASDPAVEYMKKFYGYLKAGKGRGEAMRLAKNEIKAEYPNPFYWAVFILHGEG
jgi:CHAT domain-containing protein/Tfp pilus assembly protein PilF